MPYIPHTETEVREMLDRIGVSSIDELFDAIPPEARFTGAMGLPEDRKSVV